MPKPPLQRAQASVQATLAALPAAPAHWPKLVPPANFEPAELNAWRVAVERYNEWAAEQFISADIEQLLNDRAAFFDHLLVTLWRALKLDQYQLTLIAIGGFGRAQLHPGSDVDLLILLPQPAALDERGQQQLGQFVAWLWDLRIDVGHSVRTLDECASWAADDISVATSLLEYRGLTGNAVLFQQFEQLLSHEFPWSSHDFYAAKRAEQQQRHQQFHGTSYNLEPNLKANPGGLRDIQTINWIAKRHFQTQTEESLVQYGYITASERLELQQYCHFLWRIRYALHLVVQAQQGTIRREDRLLFEFQPAVAARLGYQAPPQTPPGRADKAAVEAMMKDYYNAVAGVTELNQMLLQFFSEAILGEVELADDEYINADFALHQGYLRARHDQVFARPKQLLQLFLTIADYPQLQGIQAQTIRLLRNARQHLQQPLSDDSECRKLFMQLLRHPHGAGKAFSWLHKSRILAHYLPQWQRIVGQMQFDLFHAYTVDEHTYRLVRNLYRYQLPEGESEFPLAHRIVKAMRKPELLYVAGIFHDIAKGRGGDHSELGAIDATHFGAQHGLDNNETALVAWLVEQHLLMSITAQKRDIHDPEVVLKFAQQVGSIERLDYLYCLTVADIRATNSSLWNNWKATLLDTLYQAAHAQLEALQQQPEAHSAVATMRQQVLQHKQHAMALLLSAGYAETDIRRLWSRFTADYFARHHAEQIAWHSQHILALSSQHKLPLILVGDANQYGTTDLFIYHIEQNHLFAAVAAVIDSQRLNIHDAQIMATKDGYVMDSFVVLQDNGDPLTEPARIEELKQQLYDVLHQRQPVPENHRRLPRRLRHFEVATQVNFLPSKSTRKTTFELIALDQPGLLAKVARVLQSLALNILAAKISTVGEQAEDLFIVSKPDQQSLSDTEKAQLRAAIVAKLSR